MRKLVRVGSALLGEVYWVRPRVWAMNTISTCMPVGVGPRLRALLYRAFGVSIGTGTIILGPIRFTWYGDIAGNIKIGRDCFISRDVTLDPTHPICIGNDVVMGPEVTFITATHEIGGAERRAGANRGAAISVSDGAWIGARATILPGVQIGSGAIVAAAAVVSRNVPANSVVAGVPARVMRLIE